MKSSLKEHFKIPLYVLYFLFLSLPVVWLLASEFWATVVVWLQTAIANECRSSMDL